MVLLLAFGVAAVQAQSPHYSYTLLARNAISGATPVSAPAIAGGRVAFVGQDAMFNNTVYEQGAGGFFPVIGVGDSVPGANPPATFSYIAPLVAYDGSNIAWWGEGTPGQGGMYARMGGNFTALSGPGSGRGNASTIDALALDSGNAVFSIGRSELWAYRSGSFSKIADAATLIPADSAQAGQLFQVNGFTGADIEGDLVVFIGTAPLFRTAIYTHDGSTLRTLVDSNTTSPDGGKFAGIIELSPVLEGGRVLFMAITNTNRLGLYRINGTTAGSPIDEIAWTPENDPQPLPYGGPETLQRLSSMDMSGDQVAFTASDKFQDNYALYVSRGAVIERVLATDDVLADAPIYPITNLAGSNTLFDGPSLAVVAFNWDAAIYRLDLVSFLNIIVNPFFASGLSSWTTSGTVALAPGPAAQLTADIDNASISQLIDTPLSSYTIVFDYRFTTSVGTLELRIDDQLVHSIPAPATPGSAWQQAQVLVNDPALMGKSAVPIELRLYPGSLADVLVRSIYFKSYQPRTRRVTLRTEAEFTDGAGVLLSDSDSAIGMDQFVQYTSGVSVGTATDGADASSWGVTAFGAFWGGAARSAASTTTTRAAESLVEAGVLSLYDVVGTADPDTPVDLVFNLALSGTVELAGDFTTADPDTGIRFVLTYGMGVHSAGSVDSSNLAEVIPYVAVFEVRPSQRDPLFPVLSGMSSSLSADDIAVDELLGPMNEVVRRTYTVHVDKTINAVLYGGLGAAVTLSMGNGFEDDAYTRLIAAPGFDGYVSMDFTNTSDATVTTSTEGVRIVPTGPIMKDGFESQPE